METFKIIAKVFILISLIATIMFFVLLSILNHGYKVSMENYVAEKQYNEYKHGKRSPFLNPVLDIHMSDSFILLGWATSYESNQTKGPYHLVIDTVTNEDTKTRSLLIEDIEIKSSADKQYYFEEAPIELLENYEGGPTSRTYRSEQVFDFDHKGIFRSEKIDLSFDITETLLDGSFDKKTIKIRFLPINSKRTESFWPSV